jgi:hypothetical protein
MALLHIIRTTLASMLIRSPQLRENQLEIALIAASVA